MNHNDEKQATPDPLEIAMQAMRSVETTEVPQHVVQQTRLMMARSSRQRRWRTRALQGAAAAVVVVVLFGVVGVITHSSSSLVLADVVRNIEATKTLRATRIDPEGDRAVLYGSGTRYRAEGEFTVAVWDSATGRRVLLNTKDRVAHQFSQPVEPWMDMYGLFRQLATEVSTPIEEHVDKDGNRFPGLSGEVELGSDGDNVLTGNVKVWIDSETKLPVRLEIRPVDYGEKVVLFEQIEFDVPLDDALFDMTIPPEYTIEKTPSVQAAAKRES